MKLTTLMYIEGLLRENAREGNKLEEKKFNEMADEVKQIIDEAEQSPTVYIQFRLENDLKRPKLWESFEGEPISIKK